MAAVQYSSRISACRREPSSHEAATPLNSARFEAAARVLGRVPQGRSEGTQSPLAVPASPASLTAPAPQRLGKSGAVRCCTALGLRGCKVGSWGRLNRALLALLWHTRGRRLQDAVRIGRRRGAGSLGSTQPRAAKPWYAFFLRLAKPALPNPSLKRSANGRPPGPGLRYSVHFRQPGPGVLPLSPA